MKQRTDNAFRTKIIGITGGIGAGKSELLHFIEKNYSARVIFSDIIGNTVKAKGTRCHDELVNLLGREILDADGEINHASMAAAVFNNSLLLKKTNEIIHPAVNDYIMGEIESEKSQNRYSYLFIESAILIEAGYSAIVDSMWYIYADEEVRRTRLRTSRNYSDDKIDSIFEKQLPEDEYRKYCDIVIDNSGSFEAACRQISGELEENGSGKAGAES